VFKNGRVWAAALATARPQSNAVESFFSMKNPQQRKLNKSGASGKRLIERFSRERARAFAKVYLFQMVIV
jgi:hypothetical protein